MLKSLISLNSPDLNVLDIGIFGALAKEQYCNCTTKTLELNCSNKANFPNNWLDAAWHFANGDEWNYWLQQWKWLRASTCQQKKLAWQGLLPATWSSIFINKFTMVVTLLKMIMTTDKTSCMKFLFEFLHNCSHGPQDDNDNGHEILNEVDIWIFAILRARSSRSWWQRTPDPEWSL